LFVPPGDLLATARDNNAIPYDVPDVELTHLGEQCSFDPFLRKVRVRRSGTRRTRGHCARRRHRAPGTRPTGGGLLAISLGLSYNYRDDHEMLKHVWWSYDALYAWCRHARGETHTWNPRRWCLRRESRLGDLAAGAAAPLRSKVMIRSRGDRGALLYLSTA